MPRAVWNQAVSAEAVEIVEGNVYFAADAVRSEHLRPIQTHTVCPWNGTASYYDIVVDGQVNRDAACTYPQTKAAARRIEGRIAFWRGVRVMD